MQEFELWLQKQYSAKTVVDYLRDWQWYRDAIGSEGICQADYKEIIGYVLQLQRRYRRRSTVRYYMSGVLAWYRYLVEVGKREDNPCVSLRLRTDSSPSIRFNKLLSKEEMKRLIELRVGKPRWELRNHVMMSLLVYQGLRMKELLELKESEVDIQQCRLWVASGVRSNGRYLPLHPSQLQSIRQYTAGYRIREVKTGVQELLVSSKGLGMKAEGVYDIVLKYGLLLHRSPLYAQLIRQSVLHHYVCSGIDVRIVQELSGHKQVGSVERYGNADVELLHRSVDKYHPLQQ